MNWIMAKKRNIKYGKGVFYKAENNRKDRFNVGVFVYMQA